MTAIDLHPDVVRAITELSDTKLGRRYDRFARKRYGVSGPKLAGKTVAGEFGGRSTATGRGVVSSAGARGPAQFIPSTRQAYIDRHGIDPWAGDRRAVKAMMLHHLDTGVEGYNPGDPNYRAYILGQKLNRADRRALRSGNPARSAANGTRVELGTRTIPGRSFAPERRDARRELLLSGDIDLGRLLEYKASVRSMRDVPDRTVPTGIQVTRAPAQRDGKKAGKKTGGIYEVFHDPLGRYWDAGQVRKGAIGGHGEHVHVAGTKAVVVRLGRLAQTMGLQVGEQSAFGGTPTSGHTKGSFHYEDEAIDVSGGTPALRAKFARIAMREARRGRGR